MRIKNNLTKTLVLGIFVFTLVFTPGSVEAKAKHKAGDLLKIKGLKGAAVYQVGSDGKKYIYPDQRTFDTWHDNFLEVEEVELDELDDIDDGGTVTFQAGTKLLTHRNTAKVYAVGDDGELTHIPNEATAFKFYGDDWATLVVDIDPGVFAISYRPNKKILTEDDLPEGSLIEEEDSGDFFLIEAGAKRKIRKKFFKALGLDRKHIIKLKKLHDIYDDGDDIDNEDDDDDDIAKFDPGSDRHKVYLCHKPNGANRNIRVSVRALIAHFGHGDVRGRCSERGDDRDNDEDEEDDRDEDDTTNTILADIKIDSIKIDPSGPMVNATTTITGYIKNSGDIELTDYEPIFDVLTSFEDFVITATATSTVSVTNPLVSEEIASIVWTGYFTSIGEKTLDMTVDETNVLEESDEANNTYIETVTVVEEVVLLADLIVSDIVLDPTSPVETATTTISAYIKNSGDIELTDYEPIFDVLTSFEDFVITATATSTVSIIEPLQIGEEASMTWTGYFTSDGRKRLSATADESDKLDESNEADNNIIEYITVEKNII